MTIGAGVTNIGILAFEGCSNNMSFIVDERNSAYKSASGLLLTKDGKTLICGINGDVIIPDGVTNIAHYAFSGCDGLKSVTIPGSVASIGKAAFDGCEELSAVHIMDVAAWCGISFYDKGCNPLCSAHKLYLNGVLVSDLVIPEGVTSIEASAFWGCISLTNVTIGAAVTSIGASSFRGCRNLTSVTIPSSVTNIGNSAFSETAFFDGLPDGLVIFGSVLYAMKGECPSVLEIPEVVSSISGGAFYYCEGLTSVLIPNSVTGIGSGAFYGCSGLRDIVAPQVVFSSGLRSIFPSAYQSITDVTISCSVTNIGSYAFYNCTGLKGITFDGDAPAVGSSAFSDLAPDCCAYVRRASAGWGVEIPSRWNGIAIDYIHHDVRFDANGGMCDAAELSVADGAEIGELPVPTKDGAEFYGWFTDREGGERVTASTVILDGTTLYAHWLMEVATPVVSTSGGSVFRQDSCEVTISCATEGAAIYYTDDGSTPKRNDDYLYTGPITIADTTTFKAIAVYGSLRSDYVTATITKQGLTIEEALDAGEGVVFATGAAIPWKPFLDSTAKVGDVTVRSGAIGDRANTWLSATVEGAGTMSFWCKTSCEHDEDNMFTWDRLMIYTNDVEIAEWRMDGETDWTERALSFDGGTNTVKWVYYKDRTGADGEDCAWVDAVTWTPSEAADPIPAVAVDADAATVNAAVDGAGFVDAAVKVTIGGSAAEYNKFKTWAAGVKGATGDALAGEAAVVANAHAAAAYLLGAERLFENEPTVEIGELAIVDGESAGTTAMTVAVTVKDGESAVAVSAAKVAAMFEATGDLGDWSGTAKLTPTVTVSGTDSNGKMTFNILPGVGLGTRAFLRIKR